MLQLPEAVQCRFDDAMSDAGIAHAERRYFKKWLRYYLDFCAKYRFTSCRRTLTSARSRSGWGIVM